MNKKEIYLRIFIKSIFCISLILGFSLYCFVAKKQEDDTNIQFKKLIEGIEKNYIINVRPVDDQTQCNKNETAISAIVYAYKGDHVYDLDYIEIGEENNKQIIRLCYEIHNNYSFIALKQQNEFIKQEQQDCIYKGINFKIEETSKCPISDIKFSTDESIPNYEKIQIPNVNKLNLFLKRSDQNEVPLIDIYLISNSNKNLQFKQIKREYEDNQINKIENTEFSMDDICKEYSNKFKEVCQSTQSEQMKFNLFKQTHLAIECDSNAELLNYDTEKLRLQERDQIQSIFFAASLFLQVVYTSMYLIAYVDFQLYQNRKHEIGYRVYQIIFTLSQLFLTFEYYYTQQKFSYVIELLQGISYFNEDPLKNIYEKAKVMNLLLFIIFWTQIILFLIDILKGILFKFKKVVKFMRLEEQEMQEY